MPQKSLLRKKDEDPQQPDLTMPDNPFAASDPVSQARMQEAVQAGLINALPTGQRTLRTLATQTPPTQKRSLLSKIGNAIGGPTKILEAGGVGLDPNTGEPVPIVKSLQVPRFAAGWANVTPEQIVAGRISAAEAPARAMLLKQKMQAEALDMKIKQLPQYVKIADLGIVRIDPFSGTVEPVLKATDLQNIDAVTTALSGALGQIQDPSLRGQLTGGFAAALSAGNIDEALRLLNTGITRDAIARAPDRNVSEFETFLPAYLSQHGDTPSNRLEAVKQYRALAERGPASDTAQRSLALREQSAAEKTATSELATEFLTDARFNSAEAIKKLEQAVTLAKSIPAPERNGLKLKNPRLSKRLEHLLKFYPVIKQAILGQITTTQQFTGQQLE